MEFSIQNGFIVCFGLWCILRYWAPQRMRTKQGKVIMRKAALITIPLFVGLVIWHIQTTRNLEEMHDDQIISHFAENGEYR